MGKVWLDLHARLLELLDFLDLLHLHRCRGCELGICCSNGHFIILLVGDQRRGVVRFRVGHCVGEIIGRRVVVGGGEGDDAIARLEKLVDAASGD